MKTDIAKKDRGFPGLAVVRFFVSLGKCEGRASGQKKESSGAEEREQEYNGTRRKVTVATVTICEKRLEDLRKPLNRRCRNRWKIKCF